jgi:hypothetical protein
VLYLQEENGELTQLPINIRGEKFVELNIIKRKKTY